MNVEGGNRNVRTNNPARRVRRLGGVGPLPSLPQTGTSTSAIGSRPNSTTGFVERLFNTAAQITNVAAASQERENLKNQQQRELDTKAQAQYGSDILPEIINGYKNSAEGADFFTQHFDSPEERAQAYTGKLREKISETLQDGFENVNDDAVERLTAQYGRAFNDASRLAREREWAGAVEGVEERISLAGIDTIGTIDVNEEIEALAGYASSMGVYFDADQATTAARKALQTRFNSLATEVSQSTPRMSLSEATSTLAKIESQQILIGSSPAVSSALTSLESRVNSLVRSEISTTRTLADASQTLDEARGHYESNRQRIENADHFTDQERQKLLADNVVAERNTTTSLLFAQAQILPADKRGEFLSEYSDLFGGEAVAKVKEIIARTTESEDEKAKQNGIVDIQAELVDLEIKTFATPTLARDAFIRVRRGAEALLETLTDPSDRSRVLTQIGRINSTMEQELSRFKQPTQSLSSLTGREEPEAIERLVTESFSRISKNGPTGSDALQVYEVLSSGGPAAQAIRTQALESDNISARVGGAFLHAGGAPEDLPEVLRNVVNPAFVARISELDSINDNLSPDFIASGKTQDPQIKAELDRFGINGKDLSPTQRRAVLNLASVQKAAQDNLIDGFPGIGSTGESLIGSYLSGFEKPVDGGKFSPRHWENIPNPQPDLNLVGKDETFRKDFLVGVGMKAYRDTGDTAWLDWIGKLDEQQWNDVVWESLLTKRQMIPASADADAFLFPSGQPTDNMYVIPRGVDSNQLADWGASYRRRTTGILGTVKGAAGTTTDAAKDVAASALAATSGVVILGQFSLDHFLYGHPKSTLRSQLPAIHSLASDIASDRDYLRRRSEVVDNIIKE